MKSIKENPLFQYHPDTLQYVRKCYGLDNEEIIKESINALQDWIDKQEYFNKRDFDEDFLERMIIFGKGSVERAKSCLERLCTLKTLIPDYFIDSRFRDFSVMELGEEAFLPKLTSDHCRVYLGTTIKFNLNPNIALTYLKRWVLLCDYWLNFDYTKGIIMVIDGRNNDSPLMQVLKAASVPEVRTRYLMINDSYLSRLQAIHVLVPTSKYADTFLAGLKKFGSVKVVGRIHLHNSLESLHKMLEKDVLPVEYGGKEKSLKELHGRFLEVLSSDEFVELRRELNKTTINLSLKSSNDFFKKYNKSCDFGLQGTFRKLNLD